MIWLAAFVADSTNGTKKYRYRHADIKTALMAETGWKCVYCESKLGHNTAGDIEHKVPTSAAPGLHFDWNNLTTACSECNRRKNDYYSAESGFLDPYVDDVEELVEHFGPIVSWRPGSQRAEIAIRILELATSKRINLVLRKIEKLEEFGAAYERYLTETNPILSALLLQRVEQFFSRDSEYSAMLLSVARSRGLVP